MFRTMGLNKAKEHDSGLKPQTAGKNLSFGLAGIGSSSFAVNHVFTMNDYE